MRARLIAIIFLLLTSGCSMEKYCQKNYPGQVTDSITTVIKYEKVYDTIYVPKESISVDTLLPIPQMVIYHHYEKKSGLTTQVDIVKGKLSFKCSEDSLRYIIEQQKEIIRTIEHKNTVTALCFKEHKTKFNYFCTYWFWVTLALVVLGIFLKFRKL